MIVDISYYQIKDVERGHRKSMTKDEHGNVEHKKITQACDGFLVTRIID